MMSFFHCRSLYHRWQHVAEIFAGRIAVEQPATGRTWTFAALATEVAALPPLVAPILTSSARGIDFLRHVLHAWRDAAVFIPVDGDAIPSLPTDLPNYIVHVKTTSGSTGTPRLVLFTAAQLTADAAQIIATMGLRPDWPNIAVISMAHSYGFSNLVLPLLLHGIPLILTETPLPETMRLALANRSAVTLPAVPAMWRAWHGAGVIDHRIALAISAGAPLPLALEQEVFASTGVKIHNFYGSSECGGIAFDRTSVPRSDATIAGSAMNGVSFSIHPTTGVLLVQSPAVAEAYHSPDDTLKNNVFQTTDIVELTTNGILRLMGRTGDMINVAGRKISPSMIEDHILQVLGVRQCVTFGVPSQDVARVEEIITCVALDPGYSLSAVSLAAAQILPDGCRPRHWHHTPDLVSDSRGKISRITWRQRWLDGFIEGSSDSEPFSK